MDLANFLRRIENLMRLGTIAEIDPDRTRVRVASGSPLTDWLPWLHTRAGTSRDGDPPSAGEQVMIFATAGALPFCSHIFIHVIGKLYGLRMVRLLYGVVTPHILIKNGDKWRNRIKSKSP
ncbi:phage baseplate assembly protein V [Aquitalea sp. S1-19]|nr:phage baseplate assembly protein V [Aquitalea sp. S1-19]